VLPSGKVVHPALMEAHEEGELGEVDPKEPHPFQEAEAVGRLWGEEEPGKLLLDPFPRWRWRACRARAL